MKSKITASTFQELAFLAHANRHIVTLMRAESSQTSWGVTGRSSRQKQKLTVWLDTKDNNDRIVITAEIVLNRKNTAPEKNADLDIEISHFSDFDWDKRTFKKAHPERYGFIDGQESPDSCKTIWENLSALIEGMEDDPVMSYPGARFYKKVA